MLGHKQQKCVAIFNQTYIKPPNLPMTQHTQATIYRVLQLLTRLKTGCHRRNTLARQLGVHEKTITRYIALLTNIGYTINEDNNNRYSLAEPDTTLVTHHFEPLEIEVLGQLLVTLPDTQPLKQALWHKVVLQSNLLVLADALTHVAISKIATQLTKVVLKSR